ncbi:MAG: glutamate racemase [Lachnospiraceae bacterium]|nr:glutamate racemase [Lachnospiraceae bacterium]
MKIGIFDSGIGGLNVMAGCIKLLPDEEYEYYADSDNCPYGTKTPEQIIEYTDRGVKFLRDKGCDIVCIACNTATSVAAAVLRKKYDFPIVGVEPAVKPAVTDGDRDKRILVLATPVTVREKKLHDLIERFDELHRVDVLALPKLPVFAEVGKFDGDEVDGYLAGEFKNVNTGLYDRIVLGCTHFIHYIPAFRKIFGDECRFLDGGEGTARNIKKICAEKGYLCSGGFGINYYQSGRIVTDKEKKDFYTKVLKRVNDIRQQLIN